MTLGDVIKEYTHEHSMSQFLKDSGISKAYAYMLINNKNNSGSPIIPSWDTLVKSANGMHMNVVDLISKIGVEQATQMFEQQFPNSTYHQLLVNNEEERIILRYRQMTEDEQNLVCTMMQVKREREKSSTRIEKLG